MSLALKLTLLAVAFGQSIPHWVKSVLHFYWLPSPSLPSCFYRKYVNMLNQAAVWQLLQLNFKGILTHINVCLTITLCLDLCPETSVRDCVHHLEIQIVAVKVLNPSKCLLKLYECSLCPDQNKTWWQVPVYDIPLFISESPQFPPTEREKTERERGEREGAQGTWSVFRRKMAVSSCQSSAFWCHRLGTGLSVSQCNGYQRLTHSRDRR